MNKQIASMRLPRQAWLGGIACVHLAAFMAWRSAPAPRPPGQQHAAVLVFLQWPASTPASRRAARDPRPDTAPTVARPERVHPTRDAASPAERPGPTPVAIPDAADGARGAAAQDAPAAETTAAPAHAALPPAVAPATPPGVEADPFARPAAPASTAARALLAAGGIDRQLRKESLNKFATLVDEDKAERLSITGAAARPDPGPDSFTGNDRLVHKRYKLRGRMMCETVDHTGLGGRDIFRDGSRARIRECPQ